MSRPGSGFEIVEHTADTGIRGWSPDLPGLFKLMAQGLFLVIGEKARVQPTRKRILSLERDTYNELLHDWLEELNSLHQVHGELYSEFELEVEGKRLDAVVRGGPLDSADSELGIEVKAVTWHDLALNRTDEGFEAYVLLDI